MCCYDIRSSCCVHHTLQLGREHLHRHHPGQAQDKTKLQVSVLIHHWAKSLRLQTDLVVSMRNLKHHYKMLLVEATNISFVNVRECLEQSLTVTNICYWCQWHK